MCAKSLQFCLTLCNTMDYSPPGSSVHGILQAKYWSELLYPPLGELPNPGIEPSSLALQADSLRLSLQGSPWHRIGTQQVSVEYNLSNCFWLVLWLSHSIDKKLRLMNLLKITTHQCWSWVQLTLLSITIHLYYVSCFNISVQTVLQTSSQIPFG